MNHTINYSGATGIGITMPHSPLTIRTANNGSIEFCNDGTIRTESDSIPISELIEVTKIMKRFIMDIANDPELSGKYAYITDAAHTWVVKELTK
jgi:hypothetical protein